MQKRFFLLLAFALLAAFPGYASLTKWAPVVTEKVNGTYSVTPTDYMSASSVEVRLLSSNGTLLGYAVTTPGQSVQVTYSDGAEVHTIRKTYRFNATDTIIVVDDIVS
jgi:hypothetical protein